MAFRKLVSIDLDGTLIPGRSTVDVLAVALDHVDEARRVEHDYRQGKIDNVEVADQLAPCLKGVSLSTIHEIYLATPRIAGISETITALHEAGAYVVLASIAWQFFVAMFASDYGFDDHWGTIMRVHNGILTGKVVQYFTPIDKVDKAEYISNTARTLSLAPSDSIAIGDSRSDHPVFRAAGIAIAFNADVETQKLAHYSIDSVDLRDVLAIALRES